MIESKRLILRQFKESDLDDMYEYASQESVGPMAGWQPHKSKEDTLEYLRSIKDNPYKFAIVLKEENKVIGAIDLSEPSKRFENANISSDAKEVGYVLNEKYWSKGYVSEALDAVLNYAFNTLGISEVVASHNSKNIGSERVQEKNGMSKIGTLTDGRIWIDGSTSNTILRRITKEEYMNRKVKLYFEKPSLKRKDDAIDYINEFYKYNSKINGVGNLHRYLDNYEGWLRKLELEEKIDPTEELVPAKTFFLVRESDNKIVGMINIRLTLNTVLKDSGAGHIGYSIRPEERRKGYNKINLYLGLLELQKVGVKEAMLGCVKENLGSSRTMKALGAKLLREIVWEGKPEEVYIIDVDESIEKYKDEYEPKIIRR